MKYKRIRIAIHVTKNYEQIEYSSQFPFLDHASQFSLYTLETTKNVSERSLELFIQQIPWYGLTCQNPQSLYLI